MNFALSFKVLTVIFLILAGLHALLGKNPTPMIYFDLALAAASGYMTYITNWKKNP